MSGETNQKKGSPRVTHISWGRMDVAGFGRGRDFSSTPVEGASARIGPHLCFLALLEQPGCFFRVLRGEAAQPLCYSRVVGPAKSPCSSTSKSRSRPSSLLGGQPLQRK